MNTTFNQDKFAVFLDAVLVGRRACRISITTKAQQYLNVTTFALLAKVHDCRFEVIAPIDNLEEPGLARIDGQNCIDHRTDRLIVCTVDCLLAKNVPLDSINSDSVRLAIIETTTSSCASRLLVEAGFTNVDSISVPPGAALWMRHQKRRHLPLQEIAARFSKCLNRAGGMSTTQYFRIVAEIMHVAPSNVLVFGAGLDSSLYAQANANGRTVIVEHNAKWREQVADKSCEIISVEYDTQIKDGLLEDTSWPLGLPRTLADVDWAVILVDSPEGHTPEMPGRQQSVYAASELASAGTTVFLHDYQRDHDRIVADRYLGAPDEILGKSVSLAVFQSAQNHDRLRSAQFVSPFEAERSDSDHSSADGKASVDVSVIIPTHNEGEWLKRTVESVLAAKTKLKFEIIVVDDASTDGSVEPVIGLPNVRVLTVGKTPVGCVVARNLGARESVADYLCYLDSHVLVGDYFLDHLRETSVAYADQAFVSGSILNINHQGDADMEAQQFAYTLKDWGTESAWHSHGKNKFTSAYHAPLCPAGLMLVRRKHFEVIGGFSEKIKKWGGTDVEISLNNYLSGGSNLVDPRVCIYHYYKNRTDKKPTFSISYKQTFFNRLFITRMYCSDEVYINAQSTLRKQANIDAMVSEVETTEMDQHIESVRARFVRTWDDFAKQYKTELKHFYIEDVDVTVKEPTDSVEG